MRQSSGVLRNNSSFKKGYLVSQKTGENNRNGRKTSEVGSDSLEKVNCALRSDQQSTVGESSQFTWKMSLASNRCWMLKKKGHLLFEASISVPRKSAD